MSIIEISRLNDERAAVYGRLTETQLRNRLDPAKAVFIAESPKVIDVALRAGYQPLSLLCERRHIEGDAADIISRCGDIPVYTGDREVLSGLTGYTLTRGVLCAMRRRQRQPLPTYAPRHAELQSSTESPTQPISERYSAVQPPWAWMRCF